MVNFFGCKTGLFCYDGEHIPRLALRRLAEVEQATYTKKMFFVYAIYNRRCDKIYIGQTKNMNERLRMHNSHLLGGYTSRFPGLWTVIWKEELPTRKEALAREKQLKSFRGREFVRKYIPR